MRAHCWFCGKSVSSELPDDIVIRAICVCPECIEANKILIPEGEPIQRRLPFDKDTGK